MTSIFVCYKDGMVVNVNLTEAECEFHKNQMVRKDASRNLLVAAGIPLSVAESEYLQPVLLINFGISQEDVDAEVLNITNYTDAEVLI